MSDGLTAEELFRAHRRGSMGQRNTLHQQPVRDRDGWAEVERIVNDHPLVLKDGQELEIDVNGRFRTARVSVFGDEATITIHDREEEDEDDVADLARRVNSLERRTSNHEHMIGRVKEKLECRRD